MHELHPFVAAASRFLIASSLMLLICWLRGEKIALRHWRAYSLLGLIGAAGFNVLFFWGMQSTSAVNGALIMGLNPLLTSILAYVMLRQKPSIYQIVAFPVALVGVAIVILGAGAGLHIAVGDVWILLACLCWAAYNVLVRKMMPQDVSGLANTAGIMSVGAVALTLLALLDGQAFIVPSLHASTALFAMSVMGGVLAYLFWNAGIAKLGAPQTAIFMNLIPVTSMLIATATGYVPNQAQMLGGLLVIGAVSYSSYMSRN